MASSSPDRPQAVIYAAKSTEDTRGSIPTQIEDCRVDAEGEGLPVDGEYQDEAASAFKADRGPGLAAALEHVERIKGVLIVQHSDRLARGDGRTARHLVEIALWAIKTDVTIRSVQDPQTFENLLMAVVMGERNTEDSRRKSLAVRAGMKRRREAGKHNGGRRPYGYRLVNGELVIVDAEGEIVRRIFREFDAGRTMKQIARDLDAAGIPTAYRGRWRASTIGGILRNVVYIGRIAPRSDSEGVPGNHDPILEGAIFERVQLRLAGRTRSRGGRPPKGNHLFRGGMLRCECGEAMVPRTRSDWSYYYCNGAHQFGDCRMPSISREKVDGAVFDYFSRVALDVKATREQLQGERDRRISEVRSLRDQTETDAQTAAEKLARVRRDYTDGRLSPEDWREFRVELDGEFEAAQAQVARLSEQEVEIAQEEALGDAEQELLEQLAEIRAAIAGEVNGASDIDAVRAAIDRVFEGFVLHPQRGARFENKKIAELVDVDDGYMVEFTVREDVLLEDRDLYLGRDPQMRRVPLILAGEKERIPSPSR